MALNIELKNPFPELVKDSKDVQHIVREFKLKPPFGTVEKSAVKHLQLFEDLYTNTGSQGSCINTKLFYAFGGELEVVKRFYQGLKVPDELKEDLPYQTQLDFALFLDESGIDFNSIGECTEELSKHEDVFGNAFLRYRQATVGEGKQVSKSVIDPKKCMYLFEDEPTTICVAEEFTVDGFQKYGYELIRAYPEWTVTKNYRETIFHIKKGKWYGRPKSMNTLNWQLLEWFTSNSMMKISRTDMVAMLMFFLKAPAPGAKAEENEQDQVDKFAYMLRKLTTNEGDNAKSMAVLEYEGDTPPTLESIAINRDTKYNQFALDTAASYIHSAHDVPKEISRMVQTGAGIGSSILKDLYFQFDVSVIQPKQTKYENFWQMIFDLTMDFFEKDFDLGIRFDRNISRMIESFDAGEATPGPDDPAADPTVENPDEPGEPVETLDV